jgi:hypothetical protein
MKIAGLSVQSFEFRNHFGVVIAGRVDRSDIVCPKTVPQLSVHLEVDAGPAAGLLREFKIGNVVGSKQRPSFSLVCFGGSGT